MRELADIGLPAIASAEILAQDAFETRWKFFLTVCIHADSRLEASGTTHYSRTQARLVLSSKFSKIVRKRTLAPFRAKTLCE
jgi:hypothetical protein